MELDQTAALQRSLFGVPQGAEALLTIDLTVVKFLKIHGFNNPARFLTPPLKRNLSRKINFNSSIDNWPKLLNGTVGSPSRLLKESGLLVCGGAEPDVSALRDEGCQGSARTGLVARLARAPLQQALDAGKHSAVAGQHVLLAGVRANASSPPPRPAKLANQVARQIDWTATLKAVAERGAKAVLDLDPAHAPAQTV
ncbi:hypothetical protein GPL17_27745 [Bradyrhizobium yuanmingense]|uniref:hypothetical protein n=1 Tax=Bradyrhizobium yuanmingense TaxID=108015 RepID=UPI0012F7389F|nr:hypothetical protein [Bradyrhizobium yuanmingense]MDF0492676.1 hypothetical protein [Bradyrhizobium yuanmingense]MDF0515831.1 hypothetical protein [Bradyrhizobium yuanmingense]MVT54254.1 hypothetical protein [Bradyrhizobium yuanmingense]